MKLLYITPLWSGVKPFFFNASVKNSGMPAFYNVFLSLLKDPKVGLIFVYIISFDREQKINVPEEYKNKLVVKPFFIRGRFDLYSKFFKIFSSCVKLVRKEKINLIYSHGTLSFIGSLVGIRTKVKHFRRIYGTFLYPKLLNRRSLMISNFFEYLSFRLPADGVIITNDGTSGDKVFNAINKNSKTRLYFLLNGIEKNQTFDKVSEKNEIEKEFFTYIARVDEWKRHHLLIEALGELRKENVAFPFTYIVGPVYSKEYKDKLEELISKLDLESKVSIMGAVSRDEANYLLKNSLLSFSLYDFSNLGNVFLESLSLGTPMVAINEYNSLDFFPKNVYIQIESADIIEIKNRIKEILGNLSELEIIKANAIKFSHEKILSWEDRISLENEIIFS